MPYSQGLIPKKAEECPCEDQNTHSSKTNSPWTISTSFTFRIAILYRLQKQITLPLSFPNLNTLNYTTFSFISYQPRISLSF